MADYKAYPNIPQAKALEAFLEEQGIPYEILPEEELPKHVLEGIARGKADIEAGRFVSFDEFKEKFKISK